jgi:hypothetical protein
VAALLLALLFIFYASSGLDPETALDPAKALPLLSQKSGVFGIIGVLAILASAFGLVFTIGLWRLLRDKAPTRAAAVLGLAIFGLLAHALGAVLLWRGGAVLVAAFSKDQVAASHAWLALAATMRGINGVGDAFTGGSLLVAGWAITATGALSTTLGWLAIIAAVVILLGLFINAQILFLLGFVLAIVYLAWAGSQLRSARA